MASKLALRGVTLGVVLVVGAPPALAAPAHVLPTRLEQAERRVEPPLEDIERLSFPPTKTVGRDLLSHTVPRTFTWYSGVPDLNRDGYADVLVQTRAYEMFDDSSAPGDYFYSLALEALDGTNGTTLWTKRYEAYDAAFYPSLARVGDEGRDGFFIFRYDERSYPATVTVIALRGSGREAWRQTIPTRSVSLSKIDAVAGRATDLLVGHLVRKVNVPALYETIASSTAALIVDGRDGSVNHHPGVETRIGREAVPHPAPDLDGDRLDDYVYVDQWERYSSLPSSGEGPVVARSGSSGEELWRSDPVLTGPDVWVHPTPDLDGDRKPDVIIEVGLGDGYTPGTESDAPLHALEGSSGRVLWSKSGWFFSDVGDIDGNGSSDIMTATPVHEPSGTGVRIRARSSDGSLIYSRFLKLKDVPRNVDDLFTNFYRPGDLDGDGHPDLLAHQSASGFRKTSAQSFTLSSRTADHRRVPRDVTPTYDRFSPRRDDLMVVDQDNKRIKIVAPWRKDAPHALVGRITANGLGEYPYASVDAGRFSNSSCPGLLLSVETSFEYGGPSAAVMLDPISGRVRWSHGASDGVRLWASRSLTMGCPD